MLTSCGTDGSPNSPSEALPTEPTASYAEEMSEPIEPELPWSDEDIEAMTLTLAGECYDDKPGDKRLVCEVILNRVSTDGFGNSVISVVSAPHQFNGYWRQSREVSENDIKIATQALKDWHDNNCQPLSQYLYFSAGENRENEFREEFN